MKKYDIFISHSRKYGDNEIAHLIYNKLSPYYSVYLDIKAQDLGRFDKLLEEYISKCKDFILIISEDFFERESWVWQEAKWAMENDKNIIPVYIDANKISGKCFPDGLEDIAKISWVEYHEKRVDDVIRVITRYLKTKSNVKKCIIWLFIWVCLLVLSTIVEFIFYDKLLTKYLREYLIISFFLCLLFRIYFRNLMIDIYNFFSVQKKWDISNKKKYYYYRYFYCNKNDERYTILRFIEPFGTTIILWFLIFALPMVSIDSLLNININLELIYRKIVCIILSIVFMRIYIEIIFYNAARYWNMNRKYIIITGDKNIQNIEKNKEFIQWILHMCQEDAVFYLEKNTRLEECILKLLQRFIESNRSMKLEDYVRILKKANLENINTINTCKVCYIHFMNKDEYWNFYDKKIEGKEDERFLGKYKNILIFHSKKQTVEDCLGNAVIKNINQLSNISQIMETEIFSPVENMK